MTEPLAEMEVLHIDGDVEGKPLATGPFVMRVGQRWDYSGSGRAF